MTDPVRLEGLEGLIDKLTELAKLKRVAAAIKLAAARIKRRLQTYPPQSRPSRASVYGQTFKSQRQRRYFFYALRAGIIESPYVRGSSPGSQNIKQSWTVVTEDEGLTAIVGTNAPYAKYLHSAKEQSKYHAAVGWPTAEAIMTEERPAIIAYIRRAVQDELE